MKRALLLSILIILLSLVDSISQTTPDSPIVETNEAGNSVEQIKGLVLDSENHTALPYANIFVLHKNKGAISNEKGYFSINTGGLDKTDTLRFQYIGYKTKNIIIGELDTSMVIYLKEEIINLSEILIFGSDPDPVSIVKNVLKKDLDQNEA